MLIIVVMKLIEGASYEFRFVKQTGIDDERFWILVGPDNKKYLLPADHYKGYPFTEGEKYRCLIDKINCAGKVFLEPEHPFYQSGEIYDFEFAGFEILYNTWGEKEVIWRLADLTERIQYYTSSDEPLFEKGEKIPFRITRIRKGRLLLSAPDESMGNLLTEGESYLFVIRGIRTADGETEYYRLEDPFGNEHLIKVRNYAGYGFEKMSSVMCKVVQVPRQGYYYLEPEYPGYAKGLVYDFRYLREEEYYNPKDRRRDVWIVEDKFKNECVLFRDVEIDQDIRNGTVKGRVLYSYKGRLFLQSP
jgi:hypothetical protein